MSDNFPAGQDQEGSDLTLIDGSAPLQPDGLLALLEERNIPHQTVEHPPMWTVEDSKALRAPCDYGHTKNLFVRNKKRQMWLLTLHEDRKLDLKATAKLAGTNSFSFASPERLFHYLGVTPGSVSAFALLNDVTRQVRFCFDEALLDAPAWHIHPLINTRTTTIDRSDLLGFLADQGIEYNTLHFPAPVIPE